MNISIVVFLVQRALPLDRVLQHVFRFQIVRQYRANHAKYALIVAAHNRGANLRGFFVRKEMKAHGLQQQIEGAFRKDLRAAVIDDTITTGGSSLQAADALRAAGATVTNAFALVDRGEGAAAAFVAAGLKYRWLYTAEEVRAERARIGDG